MITINRPAGTPSAQAPGTLGFDLFQTAYVTNDFDRAKGVFGDRFGVSNWTVVHPAEHVSIGIAWMNGHQIELIEAVKADAPMYNDWLGTQDFVIRHHHFGYYVYSPEEWARLDAVIAKEGRTVVLEGDGGIVQFRYVYAEELGHYLEYVYPNEAGKAFFESAATN